MYDFASFGLRPELQRAVLDRGYLKPSPSESRHFFQIRLEVKRIPIQELNQLSNVSCKSFLDKLRRFSEASFIRGC